MLRPSFMPLSTGVRGRTQPVEKPYSGTLMGTWVGSRAPKRPTLEPTQGSRAGVGEFFNRLDHPYSITYAERPASHCSAVVSRSHKGMKRPNARVGVTSRKVAPEKHARMPPILLPRWDLMRDRAYLSATATSCAVFLG